MTSIFDKDYPRRIVRPLQVWNSHRKKELDHLFASKCYLSTISEQSEECGDILAKVFLWTNWGDWTYLPEGEE